MASLNGNSRPAAGDFVRNPDPATARILLIDDEEPLRKVVARALAAAGCGNVTTAEDGRSGLRLCAEKPFDLVITDVLMPEVDGLEVLFTLRKKHPQTRAIVMTGGGDIEPETYLSMAQCGGAAVLKKPFQMPELLAAVKKQLAASPA
jgi:DNA-binding NtrC family response regulator